MMRILSSNIGNKLYNRFANINATERRELDTYAHTPEEYVRLCL